VRYVALLRGINVGEKTLLNMSDLRACLDGVGLDDVCTYIASGNVLFESGERDATELEKTIETAVERRFQLPVNTVVFDRVGYARIVQAIPASWIGDTSLRANVAFVRRGIDTRSVVPRSSRIRRSSK
jgi:uncharacterized protein (DUF1697 family)